MSEEGKDKKNLLLMSPMLHQGGFERVCVQTARLLKDDFHTAILIFSDKDINYDISGLEVINIDVPSSKGLPAKVRNILLRIKKVREVKKNRKIDIAYSFGSSANIVNVLSRTKEKIYTGIRCSTDTENPREVRLLTTRSDRVLSCSKEIMRQLSGEYGYSRSAYIYNPLNIEDIREKAKEKVDDIPFKKDGAGSPEESVKLIVGMGRDDRIKGFWHLVKAFSIAEKEIPGARLVLLGAGSFEGCRKLAEDLKVSSKVAFPGVRKNPFPYVAAADLYVLSSNHEGFPNALLEAMALERPVIAADCKTGPREILLSDEAYEELLKEKPDGSSTDKTIEGDFGILVPDMGDEPDYNAAVITEGERELARQMIRLLRDEKALRDYGKKAGEHVRVYSPERYRQDLARLLREEI